MHHFGPFAVAIMFWIFVLGASVAGIVADYKKRRAAMEVIRTAIERGQELTPELVDKLAGRDSASEVRPEYLMVGAIITTAAGVGIVILGLVFSRMGPAAVAMWPILGGAAIVLCVGIGLFIAAQVLRKHRPPQGSQNRHV